MVPQQQPLFLVIETSARPFSAVLGEGQKVLFNSCDQDCGDKFASIYKIVESGFKIASKSINDLSTIAVDIGPGGLSSVRSGVAFANSLAFGLSIPICPFSRFDLLGFQAWQQFQLPVLCTAKAHQGHAYAGLYVDNEIRVMRYGPLERVIQEITAGIEELTIAGVHNDLVCDLLDASPGDNREVHNSKVQSCSAKTFMDMDFFSRSNCNSSYDSVSPLNEQSEIFYE
jgi:tRNA threonylcarbamoyladenosine biosynthesis protein TsaB